MARPRKPSRPSRRRPEPPAQEHERTATCAIECVRSVGTGALEARLALAELVATVESIRALWGDAPIAAELRALLGEVGDAASKSGDALHRALSRCERYLAGGPHLHLDVASGAVTEPAPPARRRSPRAPRARARARPAAA
jgi:hypothetical protein